MPHVLIVSATAFEVQPLLEKYSIVVTSEGIYEVFLNEKDRISVLITGVGMVNTAFQLGRCSHNYYDYVINAGVCGSFHAHHPIGEVVRVYRDEFSEMGAEDGDSFIRFNDMNLGSTNVYSECWAVKFAAIESLKRVSGITVNKVHGNTATIEKTALLFKPDVESMEGAAFFTGCQRFNHYLQIRAVSNMVEQRDKSKWNMPLAIANLNNTLQNTLDEIYRAH
jgi:futalosine hydrolase